MTEAHANDALPAPSIASLEHLRRSTVRDLYAIGDEGMLSATSDRMSAFDVVLPKPVIGQ